MKVAAKTPMDQLERLVLEALRGQGGTSKLREVIANLEATAALTEADRKPQSGHEDESTFAYRCRWAVTRLRKQGLLKAESPRGIIELVDAAPVAGEARVATPSNGAPAARQPATNGEPQVWIFQANPNYYRILEALQALDRLTFLTNRYEDEVAVGDVVLLWMSGKYAGIYAQARVDEGVDLRASDGPDVDFWVDPAAADTVKPRVVLSIQRRFLGKPVLKTRLAGVPELHELMILRQPNGTNFRVTNEQWDALQRLLPADESRQPETNVRSWAVRRSHGGKLYDQSCGDLLEQFVAENFEPDREYSRDAILTWFKERYPLFKPITVQCHIEKYTTNFRSRVHYNAGPEHDLLFRESGNWARLRLYRPEADPKPIHQLEDGDTVDAGSSEASRSEAARRAWDTRRKRGRGAGSPTERHRWLLDHLGTYGELTASEAERLDVVEEEMNAWLDALLVARPATKVVSPLFLLLIEGDPTPVRFTTRLAVHLMGHHVERIVKEGIESLEGCVWERFGSWHPSQPHPGEPKWHEYLAVPAVEAADKAASERLDVFAQLPPSVIGELVREPGFLSEQQQWCAQATGKMNLGVLSRQLKMGVRRPLFLSQFRLEELSSEPVRVRDLPESEVLARTYVISGIPLCTSDEWATGITLGRDALVTRLLEHPLYAVIIQLEVHRLMASLSGQSAAALRAGADSGCNVEVNGLECGPLWKTCRVLLEDLGFWPVGQSVADSFWSSAVQVALANLVTVGALDQTGAVFRLADPLASELKAHPAHGQNRGEKTFRVRLLQYLEGLQGGAR